jgi:iron complex outermembrane receptor protein
MVLACPGVAQQSAPATGLYHFTIPAEPLGDALSQLAQQTGLQVMIASKLADGVQSRELNGTYSADEALKKLLANTGLQFRFVNPRTVAINPASSAPGKAAQSSSAESQSSNGVESPGIAPISKNNSTDGGIKMQNQNRSLLARMLGLFAVCSTATHSGTACAQAATADTNSVALEEVVVTAQKRTERLLDVPMSITALSAEQLTNAGIGSSGDLQLVVPGLTTVNNGLGFVPVIRGVSSQGTSPGDESNISIYLDDVYLGAPMAGLFDLSDIERVEVLKGPQGTLFGRNATGGAIRIVTRRPSFTPKANLSLDYGFDFNEVKATGFATGPFSETVAASLSATYRKGDGYIDGIGPNAGRNYGDPDNYLVRGKVLVRPAESVEAILAADKMQSKNDAVATVWPPEGVDPFPASGSVASQPFKYAGSTQPKQFVKGDSVSVDAKWDQSSSLSVRSITAYRKIDLEYQSDIDRTSQALTALSLSQYQKNLSQEFNVTGSVNDFNWLAGLYYYNSKAGNPHWTVIGGDAPNGPALSSFTSEVDTKSYAGFGELNWNATEHWHVTLGGRYTSETKDFHYRTLLNNSIDKFDDKTWTSPTYRGVVRYNFNPDANVYLSLSNGFKSGVYDAYTSLGIPVEPEKVNAVEIGAKAKVAGITFTAAAYDYDYKDIQVSSFATVQGAVVLSLSNAASARMRGLELTADGPLTERLTFGVGANWAPTADFKDFTTAQVTTPIPGATGPILGATVRPYDASGSRIPRTPKWTANARLNYTAPLWSGTFASSVSAFYSPGFYWQAGNLTKEPSYESVALRLSWTDAADRFTYSVWGNNLTDSDNNIYRVPNVRGDSMVATQGRQIGVGIAAKF